MLSLNEIRNVHFRKTNFGGYKAEDVEAFIDEVQQSYDQLLKENADLQKKVDVLAQKLEEYQHEEDAIRSALMNAQKLGDASLRDAKHKSEIILKDATIKSEKIVANAQSEIKREKEIVDRMQKDVADFKTNLLKLYKEHLQLINNIRSEEVLRPATREAAQSVQIITPQYEEQAPMDMAASAPVGVPPVMEQNTMDTFNLQQPQYNQPPYEQPVPSYESQLQPPSPSQFDVQSQQYESQQYDAPAQQMPRFEPQQMSMPQFDRPQAQQQPAPFDNGGFGGGQQQYQEPQGYPQEQSQPMPQMQSAPDNSFEGSYNRSTNNSFERTPARGGFKVNIAPEESQSQSQPMYPDMTEQQSTPVSQSPQSELSFSSYDGGNQVPLSSVFEERSQLRTAGPVMSSANDPTEREPVKKSKSPLGLFKRRK